MHEEAKKELRVIFKHSILELASHSSAAKVCQEFNIPKTYSSHLDVDEWYSFTGGIS